MQDTYYQVTAQVLLTTNEIKFGIKNAKSKSYSNTYSKTKDANKEHHYFIMLN